MAGCSGERLARRGRGSRHRRPLETVDLDGLGVKTKAFLLIGQELLDIFALITLELDHLAHLGVGDDGAIASKLLLDDFENLLLVEFLGEALDRGQGFATIALLDTDVDVILTGSLCLPDGVFGFRERIEGLKVLNVRGHESD